MVSCGESWLSGDSRHFDDLLEDVRRAPLVLFVGAGVTAGILPTWDDLLEELLDEAIDDFFSLECSPNERKRLKRFLMGSRTLSTYERATIIKTFLGDQYLSVLRHKLYFGATKYERRPTPFLGAVAALCASPHVSAVVSYNYDNILIEQVKIRGRDAFAVCGPHQYYAGNAGLPVYHVHGFLPPSDSPPESHDSLVILSQDEYMHNLLEPFSWQTTTQLHFLRNCTCLFLGTSLTDFNMARILNHAKSYSRRRSAYVLMCAHSLLRKSWPTRFRDGNLKSNRVYQYLIRIHGTLFHDLGVKLILSGADYDSLAENVARLMTHCDKSGREPRLCPGDVASHGEHLERGRK